MTPTTSFFGSRALRGLAVILLGVLLAACSPGAASVAPSATALATPEPTAAPTVNATVAPTPSASTAAAASGSAQPDPAIGLQIAPPFTLAPLDATLEATLGAQLGQLGSVGGLLGVGGRSILNAGKPAGFVEVIALPPGMLTDQMYTTLLGAIGPSTGATFSTETVGGVSVSKATTPTGGLSIFHAGDRIIMTIIPTGGDLDAATKALIDANK